MAKIPAAIFLVMLALSSLASAVGTESDPFLGEQHEFGHVPIDKTAPQYRLFYWLFKARTRDPRAPLVVWIEGGPGCSCQEAVFMEHGPFRMVGASRNYKLNPYSWNTIADVLFTDSPIGTGLSNCSETSRIPTDADGVAEDFAGFLTNFLESHPEYDRHSTPIYFTGHSYAGHFVPAIVKVLLSRGFAYQIKGIMLGNPHTDPHALSWSYPTFAYRNKLISTVTYLAGMAARAIYEILDSVGWKNAAFLLYKMARGIAAGVFTPHFQQGDIRGIEMPYSSFLYVMKTIVLKHLKMEDLNWMDCNPVITSDRLALDHIRDYTPYLEELLDKNITMMFYYGDTDFICSTASWEFMNAKMKWHGAEGFGKEPMHTWWMNGVAKGQYKKYDNMWYIRVYEAGHIVFFYQPEFAIDVLAKLIQVTRDKN